MRKWVAVLVFCTAAAVVWSHFSKNRHPAPVASPEQIAAEDAAVANALARQDSNTVSIIKSNFAGVLPAGGDPNSAAATIAPAPAGQPSPLQFTNFAPATALENMSWVVKDVLAVLQGQSPRYPAPHRD